MPRSKPHHVSHEPDCSNHCGFASSNQRHHESYWEGRTDPRERLDDKAMMYNSHHYKVLDRQISEDHATYCLGNATGSKGQASSSGASSSTNSAKK